MAHIHPERFYRRSGLILIMWRTHSVLLRGKQLSPIQHILKAALITVKIKVEAEVRVERGDVLRQAVFIFHRNAALSWVV